MSSTTTLYANKSARTSITNPDTNYSSDVTVTSLSDGASFYVGFDQLTGANRYKAIEKIMMCIYGTNSSTTQPTSMYAYPLLDSFVENTLTYRNAPDAMSLMTYGVYSLNSSRWGEYEVEIGDTYPETQLSKIRNILSNGVQIYGSDTAATNFTTLFTTRSSYLPYIIVTFGDTDAYLQVINANPSSGYVPKHSATTFSWGTEQVGNCLATDLTVASSVFRWKTSGGTATEISCGTALSCTVPADTFSTDTILWQAEVTDSQGTVNTTEWFTMNTAEALSSAETLSPKNVVIDGSSANTFKWQHIISTGTLPTQSDLQKSTDGTTWTTLATVTDSSTSVSIPANTFTSGTWYWRVRTYNTDDAAGSWSDASSFVVIAAPSVSGVSATNEPRPKITWQSSDQVGYQVQIDDVYDSGSTFGTVYSFVCPIYLADGGHTVKVRVQNQYGLWSEWGAATFTVANTEGPSIIMSASAENGYVTIEWTRNSAYSEYLIYRDDIAIGKVSDTSYTDYFSVGSHKYQVYGIYSSSMNYGKSNIITLDVSVDELLIVDADTFVSAYLPYSKSSFDNIDISDTRDCSFLTGSATEFPIVEKSKHKNYAITINFAFKNNDANIAVINSMIGDTVCVKTPNGAMVIGPIANMSIAENIFYTEFKCTIQQIAWDEEILL